jgi:hypothetical protein
MTDLDIEESDDEEPEAKRFTVTEDGKLTENPEYDGEDNEPLDFAE